MSRHLLIGAAAAAVALAAASGFTTQSGWRTDPAWYQGKAEWALYDAVRPIYGRPRTYEATIFTNKQWMDPATTTKAGGSTSPGAVEVFKHNLSEMIPTENYAYRFLTTAFVRTDTLAPYKLAFSSQEDCGTTFRRFVVDDGAVDADAFCYFPGAGEASATYPAGAQLAFHDALSLTLRDYPFDAAEKPVIELELVADQTDTHATELRPRSATVRYVGAETLRLPYGEVRAHHLKVEHPTDGGVGASDYWFAADPALRHVMVQYEGPHGVKYKLKRLDWWAYWGEPRP